MQTLLTVVLVCVTTQSFNSANYGLALSLIQTGTTWNDENIKDYCKKHSGIMLALQKVAIEMEILDPKECRYIFAKQEEIAVDVKLVARRFQCLKDVPHLDEIWRLPNKDTCTDAIGFNRSFYKEIMRRSEMESDRGEGFREIIVANDWHYKVWDAMRDAQCDFYYITVRREALKKLIKLIGEENYDNQNFPPPVPTEFFIDKN